MIRLSFLVHLQVEFPFDESGYRLLYPCGCTLGLANIIESSAYRTNGSPRRSSSLSNSLSMMLLNNGLSGPPCGVPSSLISKTPLFITPLRRYLCIRLTTLPSFIVRLRISMSLLWHTVSKKRSKSRSTTYT